MNDAGSRREPETKISRRRLRPVQLVLAVATAAIFLALNAVLSWSYLGLNTRTTSFATAAEVNATLSNVQRESLVLLDTLKNADTADGFADAQLRVKLVSRQLHTLTTAADHGDVFTEDVTALAATIDGVIAQFHAAGEGPLDPATQATLQDQISALERPMKRLYDRSEMQLFEDVRRALDARRTTEQRVLALSLLVLVAGSALGASLRRGVRADFDAAYAAVTREMHERERAQAALSESERRFRAMVQNASDVFTVIDRGGRIIYQSPASTRALGIEAERLTGKEFTSLVHAQDRHLAVELFTTRFATAGTASAELRFITASGALVPFEVAVTELNGVDDDEWRGGLVLNYRDISERLRYQAELTRQAFEDSLTGLANRALFANRLDHALHQRESGELAVLFLDLDRFKVVNDSLGHEAGDELLRLTADRLRQCVRDGDTIARGEPAIRVAENTLARLGGDEFTILLTDIDGPAAPLRVARRISAALREPFAIGGQEVFVTASIGVALGTIGRDTPDELMRNADTAMYCAKWNGKGRHELFDPSMHERATTRLRLETDLRDAQTRGDLYLDYQPINELPSGRVVGMEALIRWRHPELGIISPAEFIPVAEETGLIIGIGRWVIAEGCRQLAEWRTLGFCDMTLSVNLSVRQFDDAKLLDHVADALASNGIPPSALCLEVTETMLMQNVSAAAAILDGLKAIGVRIAIDDFGSGHSSLGYVKQLPIDTIKIDRAFVSELGVTIRDTAIFEALISLGNGLGISIIAEGIETDDQLAALRTLDCPEGQGYLFSRPMPATDVASYLAGQTAQPALVSGR